MKRPFFVQIGTCFGLGFLPKAPGTWGSLFPLFVFFAALPFFDLLVIRIMLGVLVIGFSVATVAWGERLQEYFHRKDPKEVVSDEVAGQSLALLACSNNVLEAAVAFAAFRFFDILKPGSVKKLENYKGGWGILLDDLAAGAAAAVIMKAFWIFYLRGL